MKSSPGWHDWVRSADPLALRVVLLGCCAALSYGTVLVTQGLAHHERTSSLLADSDEYVVVVTGEALVDGLIAGSLGHATVTVPRAGALEPLIADVRRLRPTRVVVLGGPDTVSAPAAAALTNRAAVPVVRLAGQDRYETAARAALSTFRTPVDELLIARSDGAVDDERASGRGKPVLADGRCLPPGPRCGTYASRPVGAGIPVLLVTGEAVPPATTRALQLLRPRRLSVVGAVSDAVMQELQEHVSGEVTGTPTTGTAVGITTPRPWGQRPPAGRSEDAAATDGT